MRTKHPWIESFEKMLPVPPCITKTNKRPWYQSYDADELKLYLGKYEAFGKAWCLRQLDIDELMDEFCPYRMTKNQIDVRIKVDDVINKIRSKDK